MHVVSVNVGCPRKVTIEGREVLTGIYKVPVAGRVAVRGSNLAGDGQADLRVHGGPDMAVYLYPHEHYPYWEAALDRPAFPCGQFGENLTVTGYLEPAARLGDVLRVGTALLQVTQPRFPCFKLAHRMQTGREFVQRFLESRRLGLYLRVLEAGDLGAGDGIAIVESSDTSATIAEFIETARFDTRNKASLRRLIASPGIATAWRERLLTMLEREQK